MKENVLDVLMYLFETYVDTEEEPEADQNELRDELARAGFADPEIDRALDWLEELAASDAAPFTNKPAQRSVRMFSAYELARLDTECRGYVVYLGQIGILSPVQRELVLDRGDDRAELRQHDVREHRPRAEPQLGARVGRLHQHLGAGDVRGHQVGRELDASEPQPEGTRQHAHQQGLAESRRPVEQGVVQGLAALLGCLDGDPERVPDLVLPDELVEALGP